MTNKTIAVIMSIYKNDVAEYVRLSVESILNQTYKDLDLYLQYDGPIKPEVDAYLSALTDERVKIQRRAENKGLAQSLNDLLAIVMPMGYEYIARMDADDISEPERFEKQMAFLTEHPEVDVVGGAIEEIDENGKLNGKRVVYPLSHDDCRKFFRYRDPLAHPATFFRMRYFDKVAKMNGKINTWYRPEYRKNQDTMLWFDGFMSGCVFSNLHETVLHFRVAKDFYGRRNGWKRAKQMIRSRMDINKAMKYDISANLFAIAMALMTVSPTWLKKFLYRIR